MINDRDRKSPGGKLMDRLDKIGLSDCYYIEGDRIYNARKKRYLNQIGNGVYKLKDKDGRFKNITLKEI